MSQALLETLKSVGRAVYFSLLGVVVLVLTVVATSPDVAKASITLPVLNVAVNVGVVIVGAVASLAKIIDRYIHTHDNISSNGIALKFLQR